jgi:hypothetical protein
LRDRVNVELAATGVLSKPLAIMERVVMKAPGQSSSRKTELDVDLTQEIDAPLEDFGKPDEPTLSKLDFEELEIKLDFF